MRKNYGSSYFPDKRFRIAEWKRLADEATPGPWKVSDDPWMVDAPDPAFPGDADMSYIVAGGVRSSKDGAVDEQDARFIAAAREAVPALIAEVEAQRALLRDVEWTGEFSDCPSCGQGGTPPTRQHASDCRLAAALEGP